MGSRPVRLPTRGTDQTLTATVSGCGSSSESVVASSSGLFLFRMMLVIRAARIRNTPVRPVTISLTW